MMRNTAKGICLIVLTIGTFGTANAATGSKILGGLKVSFFNFSSDVSVSHHQETRDSRSAHRIGKDCWYENTWQKTLHGKRLAKREQKCK